MCETISDKHEKHMKFIDWVSREGMAQQLLPFDLEHKMVNIEYLGLCDRCFYVLSENDNHEYFIWCLYLNTTFTFAYIPIFSLVKERNKIIIKAINDSHEMYFAFNNMILNGIQMFFVKNGIRFYCIRNGEIMGKLTVNKDEYNIILNTHLEYIVFEKTYHKSETVTRFMKIVNKMRELLLEMFMNNLDLIKNHYEFKLHFANKIINVFNFLIKESDFQLGIMEKDIRHILLQDECKEVEYVSTILLENSVRNDESLPSLIIRAIIYEHSLLLLRKVTQ